MEKTTTEYRQYQAESDMSTTDNESYGDITVSRKSQEVRLEELPSEKLPNETPEDEVYSAFTLWEKRGIVLGAAIGAFLSPLTGQIYLPALPVVAADLDVSIAKINLTITTFMVSEV